MQNIDYKFTETWFDDVAAKVWEQVFPALQLNPTRVLEVGCFEGKATIWMCNNVLKDGAIYDVIDTFGGSLHEAGMGAAGLALQEKGSSAIEDNFRHNIALHPNIKFTVHKGMSQQILPTFPVAAVYDFIYIDASHRADDTFVDAYYAHKLLKPGGLLIFDDFGWKDPKDMRPVNSPELGVVAFINMYQDLYDIVFQGYQIAFIKKQKEDNEQ